MRMLRVFAVGVLGLGIAAGGGCGRHGEMDSALSPDAEAPLTLEQVAAEIDGVKSAQGHDAAVTRMKEMVKSDDYAGVKINVAQMLINECLTEDNLIVAQNIYLQMAASDSQIAQNCFGMVARASTTTNATDITNWYEKILVAPVPDDMKAYVWQLLVQSHAGDESIEPLLERLDEIFALGDAGSYGVLQRLTSVGLGMHDYDGMEKLFAAVREQAPARKDLSRLMLVTEGRMLLQQDKLEDSLKFLTANTAALGDKDLRGMAVDLLKRSLKAKNEDLTASLVKKVYALGNDYPATRNAVASAWINAALEANKTDACVSRVDEAFAAGVPVSSLVFGFRKGFYVVMESGNSGLQEKCIALTRKLVSADDLSDSVRQSLLLLLLDGAFYRNDFKSAYKIVVDGVPGYDEKWHTEMRDKVGAHLALQEGRKADAIELFRKHMARVEKWTDPVLNPTNGAKMTREAVLGFNEKRIGDIYAGMDGHADDAKAAYARARSWYTQAINNAKPGSIERKIAEEELALVPKS